MTAVLVAIHVVGIAGLALYGLLGFLTLWLFIRERHSHLPLPTVPGNELPFVTVQLPLYNERAVVQRLIAATVALDYPRDRLEIQVLDDSTDETTALAADCVARYSAEGVNITLRHRDARRGFKAGALQTALEPALGEYIAIFDADFAPQTDFLLRTIPYLWANPDLGAVQARWGHLNHDQSWLTGAQAVALDKHFAVEQLVRFRADYFPKFNGSAGVWRKACIIDAGGWQDDTVCEDLCLSTRAVLAGWQFHFAHDVVAPAELPATMLAYKGQQARWAMGATQCLMKHGRSIWRAKQHSAIARLYALLSMAAYSTHLMLLAVLLVQLPLILTGRQPPSWLLFLGLLGLGQPILFVLSQQSLYHDWRRRLVHLPPLLLIAMGIAPNTSWAVLRAFLRRDFTFARTPKGGQHTYPLSADRTRLVEAAVLAYLLITLCLAIARHNASPLALLASAFLGIGYVALLSLVENKASR